MKETPAIRLALVGMLGLVVAMGVGRFAFTPMLPLMQDAFGLTMGQAGVLASANYLGYLAGAWFCTRVSLPPSGLARAGMAVVVVATLGMGASHAMALWLCLRFAAGVASAWVLIGVSTWVIPRLRAQGRQRATGWVFAGVGTGIAVVGMIGRSLALRGVHPDTLWLVLAGVAAAIAVLVWPAFGQASAPPVARGSSGAGSPAAGWRLVICYGALGFGYIVPATFLPAMARAVIPDPATYGWVWPVFGAAAAVSTVLASALLWRQPPRRVWAWAQATLAVGVVAPVVWPGTPALLFSALGVGGTFMVITMAGLQEASRVGGAAAQPLIARMTTAFALGQLAGPLLALVPIEGSGAFRFAGLCATTVLAATVVMLVRSRSGTGTA